MQASTSESVRATVQRGRPRDPEMESRVLKAAVDVYAREGWRGFTFDKIVRAAGVGRSAIYRRWPSLADLLKASLETRWHGIEEIDCGSVEADLEAVVQQMLRSLMANEGGIFINLQVDSRLFKEVQVLRAPFRDRIFEGVHTILEHATARGELSAGVDARLVTEILLGAAMNHVMTLSQSQSLPTEMESRSEAFTRALVNTLLHGIGSNRQD